MSGCLNSISEIGSIPFSALVWTFGKTDFKSMLYFTGFQEHSGSESLAGRFGKIYIYFWEDKFKKT